METAAFLDQLKSLAANEDLLSVSREVNELKTHFEDHCIEMERQQQIAQLEAEEKGEHYEADPQYRILKDEFYEVYKHFQQERKKMKDAQDAEETHNLGQKRALIHQLRDIIQNEEHIGAAFASYKEIQEKWKTIGDIPRAKRDEVQQEYSKLLEDFFYNIKIYKELQEHDLHRNAQLKENVIIQLKGLNALSSIKEVEHQLKHLQNEWEDIGPVKNDDWEELKNKYWTEVRSVYGRINHFYDERRQSLLDNLEKKKTLLEKTSDFIAALPEQMEQKDWDKSTQELLSLQQEWKAIGFGPKKENEEIWKQFRALCDTFFEKKKDYFEQVKDVFDERAEKKKALIEEATKFAETTDWQEGSKKLVYLQKEWKKIGHAGQRNEQKLWKSFRAACDSFFDRRQKHFEAQDAELEINATKKNELIGQIKSFVLPEDKKAAINQLKEFASAFNAIGRVPAKAKDPIYKSFKDALDQHYDKLNLEGDEKEKVLFQAHLETLKASPDSEFLLGKEKQSMYKQIDALKHEIIQLENNLGFFAKSKGADALRKEVDLKIQKAHDKIDTLKVRIKMIPNE